MPPSDLSRNVGQVARLQLNAVDPLAWTTDVLTKLVNRWPASRIDEQMPWAYAKKAA